MVGVLDRIEPLQHLVVAIDHRGHCLVVERLAELLLQLQQLVFERVRIARGGRDNLPHGPPGIERRLLTQVADAQPAPVGHRAALRQDLFREEAEQRALAAPVLAYQRGALALLQDEGDLLEDLVAAVGVSNIRGLEKDGHGVPVGSCKARYGATIAPNRRVCPYNATARNPLGIPGRSHVAGASRWKVQGSDRTSPLARRGGLRRPGFRWRGVHRRLDGAEDDSAGLAITALP